MWCIPIVHAGNLRHTHTSTWACWPQNAPFAMRTAPAPPGCLFVCLTLTETKSFHPNTFITFVLNKLGRKKSLFSWNYLEKNIIQSPVWDCLAEIIEITVIVWGRQSVSRWWAAGKYRWRRQPKGQYSLLYNLSQAALNFLSTAGTMNLRAAAHELSWSPLAVCNNKLQMNLAE